MKVFITRHYLDLILITLMVLSLFLLDGPVITNPESFDLLATIGWAMVPFALCWLLLRVSNVIKLLAVAKSAALDADAALADANMWAVRHETKRQNNWSRK